MPKKEYEWGPNGPPMIGLHSLSKHRILREYVAEYIRVLTAFVGMERFRLTLVDGFAGGGEYIDPRTNLICPGSPQILLESVREATASVNLNRRKAVSIESEYYFVEQDQNTLSFLKSVLIKNHHLPNPLIRLLEGPFEQHLDAILDQIRNRGRANRAIFVLDQYGYSDVPISTLNKIFQALPNAEVFLTLAVGWITAYLPNARTAADRLGVGPESIGRLLQDRDDALDITDPTRRPDLLAVQKILKAAFTTEVSAKYYTPFFIVSRESNRPYWLLHLANSARAHDVVKALHWKIENHFCHFGGPGLDMLGYDPHADVVVTGQEVFAFDSPARERTLRALADSLPRRVGRHEQGIPFGSLFESICSETPATSELLATAICNLCEAGELSKIGANGERRAASTKPNKDDIISLPRQFRLSLT